MYTSHCAVPVCEGLCGKVIADVRVPIISPVHLSYSFHNALSIHLS